MNTATLLIEFNNHLTKLDAVPRRRRDARAALAPLAPHIGEELWQRLGHAESLAYVAAPVADEALLVDDTVEYPVQVNGKVRARLTVSADADAATVESLALADPKVAALLDGKAPKKVIVVPAKMVNVVV